MKDFRFNIICNITHEPQERCNCACGLFLFYFIFGCRRKYRDNHYHDYGHDGGIEEEAVATNWSKRDSH